MLQAYLVARHNTASQHDPKDTVARSRLPLILQAVMQMFRSSQYEKQQAIQASTLTLKSGLLG